MQRARLRWSALLSSLSLALLAAGCNSETSLTGPDANHPPTVILRGPSTLVDSSAVEVSGYYYYDNAHTPYVLVADPDGLDDISAVLFNVRTVRVRRAVAYPDTTPPTQTCGVLGMSSDKAIDLTPYLESEYPGVENYKMRNGGGFYRAKTPSERAVPAGDGLYYGPNLASLVPDLDEGDGAIRAPVKPCVNGNAWRIVGLYPPAIAEPVDGGVEEAEVDFVGVSVTVYDASGAHTTIDFPDFHVKYLPFPGFTRTL